jgi:hypothetical protein
MMNNRLIFVAFRVIMLVAVLFTVTNCKTPVESTADIPKPIPPVDEDRVYFHELLSGSDSLSCEGRVLPLKFRLMKVDYTNLRSKLFSVAYPAKDSVPDTLLIAVPTPEGAFEVFRIFPSSVMAPELAAKYPEIRTFAGSGVSQPADQIRLEITPLGFTSMILSEKGSMMINPFCNSDSVHVIVYYKNDLAPGAKQPFEK